MTQWASADEWGDKSESDKMVIPYHDPKDRHRSLQFITSDLNAAANRQKIFKNRDDVRDHSISRYYIHGEPVYALYTSSPSGVPEEWSGTEEEIYKYMMDIFDDEEISFFVLVATAFEEVTEDLPENSMKMYKMYDLESLADVIRKVQWKESVPEVGTQLLSEFVCQHPLPNTNHRSGIGVLGGYLRTFDESVELPDTGADEEWYDWAREYVLNSKRILALRRKNEILSYAHSLGVDVVVRKDKTTIDIDEEIDNLQRPDAFQYYTSIHREITRPFVSELLQKSNATHLQEIKDDGKSVFLQRIAAGSPKLSGGE